MVKKKDFWKSSIAFFLIVIIVITVDQLLKRLVSSTLALGESVAVIPKVVYLTLTHNTGMAFGMLSGQVSLSLWVSILVLGLILYFYDEVKDIMSKVALALIMGGTIGNFIDRIAYGHVIDYVNFQIWPVFNLADSALTIGVILLAISYWKTGKKK